MEMKLDNILICLDLSPIDEVLVEKCLLFHRQSAAIKQVILFHNIRYDFLEGNIQLAEKDLEKLIEKIIEIISQKYGGLFDAVGVSYTVKVLDENNTEKSILQILKSEHIDLMVMGNKAPKDGAGIIPQKVLAIDKKRTPLLLIPENNNLTFNHFLGGIDLLGTSKQTIEITHTLSELANGVSTCLYVYKIPNAYFPYIEFSNQQIQAQIEKKAKIKFQTFIHTIPDILQADSLSFVAVKGHNVTDTIRDYAHAHQVDVIIVQRINKANKFGNPVGAVTRGLLSGKNEVSMLIL